MALRGAPTAAAAAAWALAFLGVASGKDYCMPTQACWPKAAAWATLNTSVNGRLFVPIPAEATLLLAAMAAKAADPNSTALEDAAGTVVSDLWRAQQPGIVQYWSMQTNVSGNFSDFCTVPAVWGPDGCNPQTTLPSYYVEAHTPADVAATVAFAKAKNIRLVIKSSGHEVQGRSYASPDTLLLWMFHYHDDKAPVVSGSFSACAGDTAVPSVTTYAGTPWAVVYGAVETAGYHLMGGDCRTVCSAGGFTLAGGHGFAAPVNGLGVDNVLRFEVVLADGTQVQASSCQNPDLFWALRGAGGHMAVILSVTYKLYPRTAVSRLEATIGFTADTSVRDFVSYMLTWHGNVLNSSVTVGGTFSMTKYSVSLLLIFNTTGAAVAAKVDALKGWVLSRSSQYEVQSADLSEHASYIAEKLAAQRAYGTSVAGFFASRLWPATAATDPAVNALAAGTAAQIVAQHGYLVCDVVAGPGVWSADPDSSKTSVHPSWRRALWHVHGAGPLMSDLSKTTGAADLAQARATANAVNDMLKQPFPDMGAYFGESAVTEKAWQESFWGKANYCRLQAIKTQVDPDGVFWCRHCVGDDSEGAFACPTSQPGAASGGHRAAASGLFFLVAAALAH